MRSFKIFVAAVLATLATALPASGQAPASYEDAISGIEIAATSTVGTFVGTASGDLPGFWRAVVEHEPLRPEEEAEITGGTFILATHLNGRPASVTGTFAGGAVTPQASIQPCGNEYYAVSATLADVTDGGTRGGSGVFAGTLVHYRAFLFRSCRTYGASISGWLRLSF